MCDGRNDMLGEVVVSVGPARGLGVTFDVGLGVGGFVTDALSVQ